MDENLRDFLLLLSGFGVILCVCFAVLNHYKESE